MIREYVVKVTDTFLPGAFQRFESAWAPEQELIRCKDCKHATMTSDGMMCKYCAMDTDDFGDQRDVYHDADWFCADGERK